jgi:hypothetical protein
MRTTVSIDDSLLERAKRRAAANGVTLGRFVEDALRRELAAAPSAGAVDLPVHPGGALRPGIEPSSNRALYEALGDSA